MADGNALGLVVHPTRPVRDSVRTITRFARRFGARVLAREEDAERVGPDVELVPTEGFADRLDAVISLGGDGTMLGAMRLVVGRSLAGRPVPVLGVNHGHLGFLVEIAPEELGGALDRVVRKDVTLEPHSCLEVRGTDETVAFNDVVVTAVEARATVTVDLVVNGSRFGYYRGDAVIACTPTGSTAYNYAAGGPVVSPSTASVALTPVAPMSGISRSVILGGEDDITLHNDADGPGLSVSVDGTPATRLDPDAVLSLRLRADAVQIIRLDADVYARRNQVKLSLLDLPLRPDQLLDLIPQPLRERAQQLRRGN